MSEKRLSKERLVLKKGESWKTGRDLYQYRWTDDNGKRHYIYAKNIKTLREKEKEINKNIANNMNPDSINKSLNDIYYLWRATKKGLRQTTLKGYVSLYERHVLNSDFGKKPISKIKKSDIKLFYNKLHDDNGIKVSTIGALHSVIHQIMQLAVEDDYITHNPSNGIVSELRRNNADEINKKKALTIEEEKAFLLYVQDNQRYKRWYPLFKVLLGTGMRIGEALGLRWEDIDMNNNTINIDHTLLYVVDLKSGKCESHVNPAKTLSSNRIIYMQDDVKEAFLLEKERQDMIGIKSKSVVDGYSNFVFINRFGGCYKCHGINLVIKGLVNSYNETHEDKLPYFSCHTMRHTFATRLCEAGVNIKAIQDTLGHSDINITMNVYTDCTQKLREDSIKQLENFYATH